MSSVKPDASTRKPSGSSTRSGGHSPSHSPNHAHVQRNMLSSGNMLGAGLTPAGGFTGLNTGWQVWGNSTASARHASTSSAASAPESSALASDSGYRAHLGDTWGSRTSSIAWDDMVDSPRMKELPHLDSHLSVPLHQVRQRHVTSPQAVPMSTSALASRQGQPSSQRYGSGQGRDSSTSIHYSPVSPARPLNYGLASSPYSNQRHLLQNGGSGAAYDSSQTSSFSEGELSNTLRGMVVADDLGQSSQADSYPPQPVGSVSQQSAADQRAQPPSFQVRPPQVQQAGIVYGGYSSTDYPTYYTGPLPHLDYPYGYDAYRTTSDPTFYAASPGPSGATPAPSVYSGMTQRPPTVVDVHAQQPPVFYDYMGQARAMGSQYYYPAQPMVFHHPSTHIPADKKRGSQHRQSLHTGVIYPNAQSTPYATGLEYQPPHPMLVPPGHLYGHGIHPASMQFQDQHGRRVQRRGFADQRNAARSPLLDEFRADKNRTWELKDIHDHIVEFSGDQHGSRFIQEKLEMASIEERQVIYNEIVPEHALQLIQDVFGNYVIQKLFEYGDDHQKTVLTRLMEGHVLPLSLQMYGCRVVQKAVDYITPEQQSLFIGELEVNVLRCVKDANGNHVIQKLIERVAPERLSFLKAFRGNVFDLATHPYGCRVLQRCFEHLPEDYTRPLVEELHKHVTHLMQDQFGNYVVQFVLEHGKPEDRAVIVSKLRGQMLHMARHKFASNVCEKALITAEQDNRRLLIDELMTPRQDGLSPILTMMRDQYANYVLQRALSVVEGEQKAALFAKVKPQLSNMRRYSSAYSKHLIAIERLLEQSSSTTSGTTTPKQQRENMTISDANPEQAN